jgi:hypothetical protein
MSLQKTSKEMSVVPLMEEPGYDLNSPTLIGTSPSSKNFNQWAFGALSHFRTIFSKSPETVKRTSDPLLAFLQKYGNAPYPIKESGNVKVDGLLPEHHISISNLFGDLIGNDKRKIVIQDAFKGSRPKRVVDLLAALAFESKGEKDECPLVLGAVNVLPHEEGTATIDISLPNILLESGSCSKVEGGFIDNTSVITSPGYLTEPHLDYFCQGQLILHVKGIKIWFIWPPTIENLKAAVPLMLSEDDSYDFTIAKALAVLTDLEIRICSKKDEWFILEPGAIHGVISVTSSGHKNKLFTDFGHFETWATGHSLLIETLVLTHRARGVDDDDRKHVVQNLRESCKCFYHWDALLGEKRDHPAAAQARKQLGDIKKVTMAYLNELDSNSRKRKRGY